MEIDERGSWGFLYQSICLHGLGIVLGHGAAPPKRGVLCGDRSCIESNLVLLVSQIEPVD